MKDRQWLASILGVALIAGATLWPIYKQPVTPPKLPVPVAPYYSAEAIERRFPIPHRPDWAIRAHEHGACRIRVRFGAQGNPQTAEVLESSGFADLDAFSAEFAMENWHNAPNTRLEVTCIYPER